jgi:hypothetical protein
MPQCRQAYPKSKQAANGQAAQSVIPKGGIGFGKRTRSTRLQPGFVSINTDKTLDLRRRDTPASRQQETRSKQMIREHW